MDTVYYYRDSDGVVVGSTTSQNLVDFEKELTHFGPGISALRADRIEFIGKIRKVVSGQVVLEPDPIFDKKKSDRKNAMDKAIQKLGITADEATALFGG